MQPHVAKQLSQWEMEANRAKGPGENPAIHQAPAGGGNVFTPVAISPALCTYLPTRVTYLPLFLVNSTVQYK